MTADVELLPLPAYDIDTANHAGVRLRGYTSDLTRAIARANLAERDAEVEALRAEVERLEIAGRLHSGTADLAINAARASEARAERLAGALRGMLELRELTQRGEVHPNRHELDVVREARAALEQESNDA